jgi:putative endonuclease
VSDRRQRLGRYGEDRARRHLQSNGYSILDSNFRTRNGEIDLIAERDGIVSFVEVRTRKGTEFGTPEESITREKQARLVAVAQEYMQLKELGDVDWRIDVVALTLDARGRLLRLEVIENAVEV